jgi:predicted NUDIX family NTP pyrophosphohydrolase
MATVSAGILMYDYHGSSLVVLLVHPGGPYWRNRDLGAWSIPKYESGKAADAESAARREFKEELGIEAVGPLHPLGDIRQRSGKMVRAFALKGDIDVAAVHPSKVTTEPPPPSGRTIRFPEIDRARVAGSFSCAKEDIGEPGAASGPLGDARLALPLRHRLTTPGS